MSESARPSAYGAERAAVDAILADLQRRWPDAIALEPERRSDYFALPYLLLAAFPGLTPADIRPLAAFCKLYAGSILLQDRLIDGAPPPSLAVPSLRILAMQIEAYHLMHPVFPAHARFWDRLRDYLADHAEACVEEERFTSRARPWCEYTEAVALRVIAGKNGVARIIAAAMAELAGDDHLLDPLIATINAFNLATQLWDDLQDWKDDLRRGTPTLVLSLLISERTGAAELPERADPAAWSRAIHALAHDLYYGGHARYVIDLALAALDTAEQLRAVVPDLGLYTATAALRRSLEGLRADLARIVADNLQRARVQPRIAVSLPPPATAWQDVAWGALRFLETQWNLGFGEARDLMQYPAALGLGPAETCYVGDVFQRALLADALCDADRALGGQLRPIIAREASYLVDQRIRSSTGGWRYFSNLPELPPDADDLAQVMQALIRAGCHDEVVRHGEAPLAVLLRDGRHRDGSLDTWIVPAADRTPLEQRHAALVERVWGAGADCDVIPNLLYALQLYDTERFADTTRRGIAYLEAQQHGDGSWTSRWYAGPYYAIYVCLRLFGAVEPASPAVARALQLVRATQRYDGGWGLAPGASDPLTTALALLGLSAGQRGSRERGDRERAAAGLGVLRRTMHRADAWPAHPLIFKGLRAFHGSRTLTTAFVLKAALAWQDG